MKEKTIQNPIDPDTHVDETEVPSDEQQDIPTDTPNTVNDLASALEIAEENTEDTLEDEAPRRQRFTMTMKI